MKASKLIELFKTYENTGEIEVFLSSIGLKFKCKCFDWKEVSVMYKWINKVLKDRSNHSAYLLSECSDSYTIIISKTNDTNKIIDKMNTIKEIQSDLLSPFRYGDKF